MSETAMPTGLEMARQFYLDHELVFQRAATSEKIEDRVIPYSDHQFDTWAVGQGYMPRTAKDCNDVLGRRGITELRYTLRVKINDVARKGEGLTRAFSIEARYGKWRIELSERFLAERPGELLIGMKVSHKHFDRQLNMARKLVSGCNYLDEGERTTCLFQLESASQYNFFASQSVVMALAVVKAAHDGTEPDFVKVRKDMREVLDRATGARPPKAIPRRHRKRPSASRSRKDTEK